MTPGPHAQRHSWARTRTGTLVSLAARISPSFVRNRPDSRPIREAAGRRRELGAWLTPVNVVIAAATLLALGLRFYWLFRPTHLLGVTEYDDGSYFGSAVRLVRGVVPYRDFVFVQPPGITLLMVPFALLAKVTGTAWGLAIGRIVTVLASGAGVPLTGLLVRHRGVLAAVLACGLLAVYPDSVAAAHTVLVEPWLVLFCLIGAVAVFDRDHLAGGRRLFWGGIAFGFGGAVEAWAIVPVLVVFALSLPRPRLAGAYAGGVAAGFLIPVLPFFALAPRSFYDSVITAQVGSRVGAQPIPFWYRIQQMSGLTQLHGLRHGIVFAAAVVIVALVILTCALASMLTRRPPPALEWFALATATLVVAMFLWPKQFHYHFSGFLAPFFALAIALPVSRLMSAVGPSAGRPGIRQEIRWAISGVAVLAIMVASLDQAIHEARVRPRIPPANVPDAAQVIPPGACVLTDQVSYTIAANRFVSDVPGCPTVDDGRGTNLALSGGRTGRTGAGSVPAVAALWRSAFEHADYVWLSPRNHRRIPWTPALTAYFHAHFVRVTQFGPHIRLYARKALPPH